MYSFIICIVALILGYFIYGKVVERMFSPDPSLETPATRVNDGVDFVPMPAWKVYMIQFLNIAGTGPIFGAIMGAKFGPACYLWIVFGCIFAGAVHDYLSGMISVRYGGISIPQVAGHFLGKGMKNVMMVLVLVLLLLVGTVFVYSPSMIIADIAPVFGGGKTAIMFWLAIIFVYYLIATFLPIDKLIGKIYPLFAFAILFMASGLMVCLFIKWPAIPELWDGLFNRGPSVGLEGQDIFPCLFITVACGAISGFHATQSPLMARCMTNEKQGRPIFYGAMITEGIVALIWAAVSSYFFFDGGQEAVHATGSSAPQVVTSISGAWLGTLGSILAILGVVAAPITSGDTAFRSARLMVADYIRLDQKPVRNRLAVCLPLFGIAALLLWYNISDADGFNTIWRYFGWANQTLATFVLWMIAFWLNRNGWKSISLLVIVPAIFLTSVVVTYILVAPEGFRLSTELSPWFAAGTAVIAVVFANTLFYREDLKKRLENNPPVHEKRF